MHIERRRGHRRRAQHQLNLRAMVCLVIENVREEQREGIGAKLPRTVHVTDFPFEKVRVQPAHEFLNARIFALSSGAQAAEVAVKLGMKRRPRTDVRIHKAGHPKPVAEQNMIERSVDALE